MEDLNWVVSLSAGIAPALATLGALAYWKGRTDQRLDGLEGEQGDLQYIKEAIHAMQADIAVLKDRAGRPND